MEAEQQSPLASDMENTNRQGIIADGFGELPDYRQTYNRHRQAFRPDKKTEGEKRNVFKEIGLDEDLKATSQTITVGNVQVYFPFSPYPDQVKYISKVIEALDNRKNALLESPTGTGKTLCLLTSTLAWLAHQRSLKKNERSDDGKADKPIKVVYTSRTHSQLKQVVSELKATVYRPMVSVVGSRDHTCINHELSHLKGRMKNLKCTELTEKNKCTFYKRDDKTTLQNWRNNIRRQQQVLDIEELAAEGKRQGACPFYEMKLLNEEADLLVMPYNYLTDKRIRDGYASKLQNSVLIFDEAHNIEQAAEEGSSVTLSTSDFQAAGNELDQIERYLKDHPTSSSGRDGMVHYYQRRTNIRYLSKCFTNLKNRFEKYTNDRRKAVSHGANKKELEEAKDIHFAINLIFGVDSELPSEMPNAEPVPTAFDDNGLPIKNLNPKFTSITSDSLFTFIRMLSEIDADIERDPQQYPSTTSGINLHKVLLFFVTLIDIYKNMIEKKGALNCDWHELLANHYQANFTLHITEEDELVLDFWCLNPGVTFQKIVEELQPISILLTSGTLSPIESYEAELKIPFDYKLSCQHVIDPSKQVFVRVVKNSLNRQPFNFNYMARNNDQLFRDLGNSLINLLRVVPGGVLVFFTSYQVLISTIKLWRDTVFEDNQTFYQKLESIKAVCTESRDRKMQDREMKKYLMNYKKGAVFLGVCGGKLSEGIDFADDMARLVVMVGIPYGYLGDNKNKSKMAYLDQMSMRSKEDKFRLTGKRWYELKAMRAISQAIGRVIRHKDDFGGILFFDQRMENRNHLNQLSGWVSQQVKVEDNLVSVIKPLRDFYRNQESVSKSTAQSALEQQAIRNYEDDRQVASDDKTQALRPRSENESHKTTAVRNMFADKPTMQKLKPVDKARMQMNHFGGALSNLGGTTACEFEEDHHHSMPVHRFGGKENDRRGAYIDSGDEEDASNSNYPKSMNSRMFPHRQEALETKRAISKEELPIIIHQNLMALVENFTSQDRHNPQIREIVGTVLENFMTSQDKKHDCPVCYNETEDNQFMTLKCGHTLCKLCTDKFIKKAREDKPGKSTKDTEIICPQCKVSMKPKDLKQIFLPSISIPHN